MSPTPIVESNLILRHALKPITFTSFTAFRLGFLDVPDLGHREVSGIIVKGWHGTSIPHFHAHILEATYNGKSYRFG